MSDSTQDINARLEDLESQYESGKRAMTALDEDRVKVIGELDDSRRQVAISMYRLEGAMTVLRQMGAKTPAERLEAQRVAEAKAAFPDVISDLPLPMTPADAVTAS